jgi:hypothetical protein
MLVSLAGVFFAQTPEVFIQPNPTFLPQGSSYHSYRTVPQYSFSRNPEALLFSYYDYMIGSYNNLPLRVIPPSAGGGYFMTYHASRTLVGTRRVFYTYLDENGNVINNLEISETDIREGYPALAVDPVSGKPLYAWHSNADADPEYEVVFTSDAFVDGIAGLFNTPQIIIDAPVTINAPDGTVTTDNEFLWASAVIGTSPIANKRRVYVLCRNFTSHTNGPCENVYIVYADFDVFDIENEVPLVWSHTTIPELDQWNVDSIYRRPFLALTVDNSGNLYYCGYHFAVQADGITPIDEADIDIFKCTNYGAGTWSRTSFYSDLPAWNPPIGPGSQIGYFADDGDIPYADNELSWKITNSGHLNAVVDSYGRIHVPGLWALHNADGGYYSDLQFMKEIIFNPNQPAESQSRIREVYPQKDTYNLHAEYFQPWDTQYPWGVVDQYTGDGVPDMVTDWNFPHWDASLYDDAMMFHYNGVKITEDNGEGMMAMVWQNSLRAKKANEGDPAYAAYLNTPEIFIAVSQDHGSSWSEPIVLNNVTTPQLAGIKPMWVYPADKVIYTGMLNGNRVGKLGLMFYNDYDWGTLLIGPPTQVLHDGGQVMFAELEILFSINDDNWQTTAPMFNPPAGNYPGPVTVALTCATPQSSIYYTLDGSIYGSYTAPFTLQQSTTVRAVAVRNGYEPSGYVSATYTIPSANPDDPATPVVNGIAGIYPNPFSENATLKLGINHSPTPYSVKMYNLKGELVHKQEGVNSGYFELNWTARDKHNRKLAAGVYFVTIQIGNERFSRKVVVK